MHMNAARRGGGSQHCIDRSCAGNALPVEKLRKSIDVLFWVTNGNRGGHAQIAKQHRQYQTAKFRIVQHEHITPCCTEAARNLNL